MRPLPSRLVPAIKSTSSVPLWLARDGRTIYGHSNNRLLVSTDDWETVVPGHEFPSPISAVRELDDGELLVATWGDPSAGRPGSLWRSTRWAAGSRATKWTRVLDASGCGARFTNQWGLDACGNVVVACEYGSKQAPHNARMVYLSADHGVTWKPVFEHVRADGAHTHAAALDPWDARLWVTTGDYGFESIQYSDDWGATWNLLASRQATTIVPLADFVLFLSDSPPNGVWGVRRSRDRTAGLTLEVLYRTDDLDALGHVGEMAFRRREPGAATYLSFTWNHQGLKNSGLILATCDGERVYEVFRDWETYAAGSGGRGVLYCLGPTAGNRIIAVLEATPRGAYSLLRAEAPAWVP